MPKIKRVEEVWGYLQKKTGWITVTPRLTASIDRRAERLFTKREFKAFLKKNLRREIALKRGFYLTRNEWEAAKEAAADTKKLDQSRLLEHRR